MKKTLIEKKTVCIDWDEINDMAKLMSLVYSYEGEDEADMGVGKYKTMWKSLVARKDKELSVQEMEMLRGMQAKYPEAELLKYFTNSADLQCVVGKNPKRKHLTVVFRGSDSIMDWLVDLMFIKTSLGDGIKVHRGFHKQLFNGGVYGKLVDLLREQLAAHPGWRVCISGHSLGAAVSTLSSYLLAQEFPDTDVRVFAFASPKCGNARFKDVFNALPNVHMYRICYGRDLITATPTFWYSHVGHNLWYDKTTQTWHYYDKHVRNDYYLCSYYNWYDHPSPNYIQAVEAAANAALPPQIEVHTS